MPKKYEEEFKENAIRLLKLLNQEGSIVNEEGVKIHTVKELCSFLGISTWTIYSWEKNSVPKQPTNMFINGDFNAGKEIKFGSSFWMFLARNLGIPNYRVDVNSLKVKIAEKLLETSGKEGEK